MKLMIQLFLLTFLLSSCGKNLTYFTKDLYKEYQWSDRDLKKIQFYVSQDIVLYRGLSAEDTRIQKGKIRVEGKGEVEEIVIKRGTPGVFVMSPKEDRFAISFEEGKREFLMFGPNSKANGRFVLLAKDWNKNSGEVTYGGTVWETSSESAYAALMVDMKRAKKTKYRSKTAEGNRVD